MQVVLLVGFELGDDEQKGLILLLAQEFLGTISDEIDAVLIFVGNFLTITVPDGSFVWMRRKFQFIGGVPKIEEAAAVLGRDVSATASLGFGARGEMPLANIVCCIAGLTQFGGDGGQVFSEPEAVVPNSCFAGITAGEHDGARGPTNGLVGYGVIEIGPSGGECVDVWRVGGTVEAVGSDEVPTELVGVIDDDVRAAFGGRCLLRRGRGDRNGSGYSRLCGSSGRSQEKVSSIHH